jgi:hypothetical protein
MTENASAFQCSCAAHSVSRPQHDARVLDLVQQGGRFGAAVDLRSVSVSAAQ